MNEFEVSYLKKQVLEGIVSMRANINASDISYFSLFLWKPI